MPQTVKISAGYSDKTSENYNSTQYSLNLELDVVVNGSTTEIESASQRLFNLAKRIVLAQRSVNVDTLLNHETPQSTASAPLPSQPTSNGNGAPKMASEKQLTFLRKLARETGLNVQEIQELAGRYSKQSLQALSSFEVSCLINEFVMKRTKAA